VDVEGRKTGSSKYYLRFKRETASSGRIAFVNATIQLLTYSITSQCEYYLLSSNGQPAPNGSKQVKLRRFRGQLASNWYNPFVIATFHLPIRFKRGQKTKIQ